MKQRITILCKPVLDRREISALPDGTITDRCSRCGVEVWLAPSGQQLKAKGGILVCLPCGLPMAERQGVQVTKEQLEEIERCVPGGAAKAKDILRRFNARSN
jgi:hypothetical protein